MKKLQAPPIFQIENIRDLLVGAMAPDLMRFMLDQQTRYHYPKPLNAADTLTMMQEIVAFILDHVTPISYEKLALLYAELSAENKQHAPSSETGTEH